MKKALIITVAVLGILVLLLTSLLFSHTGNKILWQQVCRHIEGLNGDLVGGQLLNGWTIKQLSWQDSTLDFQADHIQLKWQPFYLLEHKLPVELIEIEQAQLTLHPFPNEASEATPAADSRPLDIPLDINIRNIHIRDFHFVSSAADVQLGSLSTDARLNNNRLILSQSTIDQLQVLIHTPDTEEPQEDPTTAISLPEVKLPLPIKINHLNLTDSTYQQGSINEAIHKLSLSFDWQDSLINDINLSVDHDMASASLVGQIDLAHQYPLDAVLKAQLHKPLMEGMLDNEQLTLQAKGDLAHLKLSLEGSGPVTATLKGSIDPIQPDLPFNLQLDYEQLSWPLTHEPKQITAQSGTLTFAGNLSAYTMSFNSSIEVPDQPATHVSLKGKGNLNQIQIKQLLLKEPEGQLELSGLLDWQEGIRWQGKTTLVDLNPGLWVPAIPGTLNGSLDVDFLFANNQWQVDIPTLDIKGKLRQLPLALSGKIFAKQASQSVIPIALTIDKLSAVIGQNTLSAHGQLSDRWSMKAKLDAKALQQIYPDLQGSVQGRFDIQGHGLAPSLRYQLESHQLLFQQLSLSGLQATGEISKDEEIKGNTQVAIAELLAGGQSLHNLNLQVQGSEEHHQLTLSVEGQPVSGNLQISGAWKNQQWNGQLSQALINTPLNQWQLEKPLTIAVNSHQQINLSKQCWHSLDAQLCLEPTEVSAEQGTARLQLSNFDVERLKPFFPDDFNWQAALSAKGDIHWQNQQPTARLTLSTTPGTLASGDLTFDYHQLELLADFQNQRLDSSLKFQSKQLGTALVKLSVDDVQEQQALSGKLQLDHLRLDFLTPLAPAVSAIDGVVSAKADLAGTLKNPLIYGDLMLDQGQLNTTTNMVSITDLSTRLTMKGNQATIDGGMKVGEGQLNLGGHINWQQMPPSGEVTLKGEAIDFQYPGILSTKASPDLRFTLGKTMALTGKIVIPWARIEVKELPKSAVKVSDDAIIITHGEPEAKIDSAPFNMKVAVILGDDIKLDAYGLATRLEGHLLLIQKPDTSLSGDGSIQLVDGRYLYLGQDLLIEEGKIIFSGPITSPYLMIDAIRNPDKVVDDTRVGIKVNGSVKRPQWEVYTDSAMSQEEQLSYLLRGRGLDSGDSGSVESMLLSLGIKQFGGVLTSAGEAIGLSDVTLETEGSGDDTQVTIGGNIAPGLRLSYGAGVFNSIAEIKIRYELMPQLYVQAVSGLAQAVDVFYRFKIESDEK